MESNPVILYSGVCFLIIFIFGFWLKSSGKPYNGLLFNTHKLVAVRPNVAPFWTELAALQLSCGQVEEALRSCREALKIDPGCQKAEKLSRMIRMGWRPSEERQ